MVLQVKFFILLAQAISESDAGDRIRKTATYL